MLGALARVILGFALAALMAGLVFVLFAMPPTEFASSRSPGLGALADWSLKAATQAAIFAAPFALIAAAIGEWQSLRGPIFYSVAGLLIAAAGFLAQQSSETAGQVTVVNPYAIGAFFASGLAGGLVYWLIAGRVAGEDEAEPVVVRPTTQGPGGGGKPAPAKPAETAKANGEPKAPEPPKPVSEPKPAKPATEARSSLAAPPAKTVLPVPVPDARAVADAVTAKLADEARPAVSDPEAKV